MRKFIQTVTILLLSFSISVAKDFLIVDTSGSLSSKEKEVKDVVDTYLQTNQEVLAFSDAPYFIEKADELEFGGGTALSLALQAVQPLNIDFLTIISDGVPDDEAKTLKIAQELRDSGVKICGIFISDSLEVPNTFKIITDRTFAVTEVNKALEYCNDSVKQELLGTQAKHKEVNGDKYVF